MCVKNHVFDKFNKSLEFLKMTIMPLNRHGLGAKSQIFGSVAPPGKNFIAILREVCIYSA